MVVLRQSNWNAVPDTAGVTKCGSWGTLVIPIAFLRGATRRRSRRGILCYRLLYTVATLRHNTRLCSLLNNSRSAW